MSDQEKFVPFHKHVIALSTVVMMTSALIIGGYEMLGGKNYTYRDHSSDPVIGSLFYSPTEQHVPETGEVSGMKDINDFSIDVREGALSDLSPRYPVQSTYGTPKIEIGLVRTMDLSTFNKTCKRRDTNPYQCMTCNLYYEARSEGEDAIRMVAEVVLNRVKSKNYANTVCGVVWENRQFSWTIGISSHIPKDKEALKKVQKVAKEALINYEIPGSFPAPYKVDPRLLYYHDVSIATPTSWVRKFEKFNRIDDFIFFLADHD